MERNPVGFQRRPQEEKVKKKKISSSSAKDKGRRLQQWVCEKISTLIGLPWGADQPIESRPMGQSGCDVRLDALAAALFPFDVECKHQETWAIPAWVKQAQANNKTSGRHWLLVVKRNRTDPLVVLDASVFFDLLAVAKAAEK